MFLTVRKHASLDEIKKKKMILQIFKFSNFWFSGFGCCIVLILILNGYTVSVHKYLSLYCQMQASVTQLDERPTGDQEVAVSTPTRSARSFHGDMI